MKTKNLLWIIGILFIIGLSSNVLGALTDGLKGYWSFDSGNVSGNNIINSIVGNSNFTNYNGTFTTTAKIGNAYNISRTDIISYAVATNENDFDTRTNNFTYCYWIYSYATDWYVLSKQLAGSPWTGPSFTNGIFGNSNKAVLSLNNANLTNSISTLSSTYSYVCNVRGNGRVLIYINGTLEGNGTDSGYDINSAVNFQIGRRDTDSTKPRGLIDELGFWDRILSNSEISELYNSGNGLTYPFSTTTNSISFISPTPINDSFVANNFSISTNTTFNTSSNTTHYIYNASNSLIYNITSSNNPFTSTIANLSNGRYFYNATSTNGSLIIKTDTRMISFFNANVSSTSSSCVVNLGLAYFRPNNCGDI